MMPLERLHPNIPLFPAEQSLAICLWLATLTERELAIMPRRRCPVMHLYADTFQGQTLLAERRGLN